MDAPTTTEEQLFQAARALTDLTERSAYLDAACAGDSDLRRGVERLLAADGKAEFFFADGAAALNETMVDLAVAERPGDRIGRYKLLQKIGEGGCGVVYMAEQEEPVRRRVALKVIKLGMDTKSVITRFEAERQALAMMDHPNIAKVLDAGATDAGRPYFVMELVRGVKITEYCDEARLSTRDRLDLFIKVCQAIQHAHQKGIIHRDIKPSNILVTTNDGVAVPKVIDFGIAKATEGRLTDKTLFTQFEALIGTPAYMSPEQAVMTSLDIDTRSDIYSLGVLLYELLAGKTPFDTKELLASGVDEMRRIIREREPIRPSTRLTESRHTSKSKRQDPKSNIENDLDWIVMKCLEKDRSRRYETANALAMDLKRHLNNETVLARPPSTAYRMRKAFRRNKLLFTAGAGVLAALLAGLGVSLWQAAIATRERNAADEMRRATERLSQQAVRDRDAANRARILADDLRQRADQERLRAESNEDEAQRSLYAATMKMVQQVWKENSIARMRQLLDETARFPDRELGEFEWHFWQRQIRLARRTLRGHLEGVDAAAFSPDGRMIASTGGDGAVKMWDARTGQELWARTAHNGRVFSLAFAPDGKRLVSGSFDRTAKVWDVASGRLLHSLEGHRGAIWRAAFSTNGLVATGSSDNTAMVWEPSETKPRLTLKHGARVISVDFSDDGRRLATSSRDGAVRVWDALRGDELHRIRTPSGAFAVNFFPDSNRLVAAHQDGTARVWEVSTGQELLALRGHGPSWVIYADVSRDGRKIVTGSHDNTAKVWDADTGQELLTLKGHAGWVRWAEFSPDGQSVVTGSHDRTVKVWNLSPKDDSSILGAHTAPVRSVAASRDGQWMVTGSEDQTAVIWALRSGARQFVLRGHDGWVSSVAFAPDGARIATGSEDHTATLWSAVNGREILKFEEHGAAVYAVAYSPNGQWLATGSADRSAIVWDVATGEKLHSLQGHSGSVWAVAFSPDGQRLLTGSEDGSARIWDASAGRPIQILQDAHRDPVRAVAWSPDGGRFLTASVDGTAIVWDAATGTNALAVLTGHRGPIWSAAYYLSGRRNIWTAAFSPSGRRIVTGGDDGTVRVWDAASGQELLALDGPAEAALSAAFSPDGRSIVAGSADGRVWRWEMASPHEVAAWQAQEHREDQRLAEVRRALEARERQAREARAGDPGAIKQWLILGPIRLNVREEDMDNFGLVKQQVIAEAMEHEQIPDAPEQLLPRAGYRVEVDHRRLVWQAAHFDDYIADFAAFFGRGVHWRSCVGYAVCYIHSESGQAGLQMRVAWDDFVKVYLNGALVYRSEQSPWNPEAARVQGLSLHRGRNVLVLKLADEIGDWKASIRFTDSADNPVQGIRVTLSPDEP